MAHQKIQPVRICGTKAPTGKAPFTLRLQFDGGSKGNPGPGYGSYRVTGEHGVNLYEGLRVEFPGRLTNNEAEYLALIAGLEHALMEWPMPAQTHMCILSDSMLVVNQVKGRWRIKFEHLRRLCLRASDLLQQFKSSEIKWVGRAVNVVAFGH